MPRQLTTRKACRLIPGVFRVCLLAVRILFAHFRIACQNSVFAVGSVFFVVYLGHLLKPVVWKMRVYTCVIMQDLHDQQYMTLNPNRPTAVAFFRIMFRCC